MNLGEACRKCALLSLLVVIPCQADSTQSQPQPGVSDSGIARVVELRIVARKPEGGVRTIRALRGESIVLRIRSDEEMTIHVHGYDVRQHVTADTAVKMTLVTRWVGRFPVTAHLPPVGEGKHGPEPTLLYLEVHPQ